ncbi:DUF317 domain-containing protein [Streptomyces sp. NPDC058240]|uniref:DUF317 domain-containing protein n=1 Tax=Streptomyces sp. NPDC058240 TaxID=3346396 RepID=UPI0036E6F7C4
MQDVPPADEESAGVVLGEEAGLLLDTEEGRLTRVFTGQAPFEAHVQARRTAGRRSGSPVAWPPPPNARTKLVDLALFDPGVTTTSSTAARTEPNTPCPNPATPTRRRLGTAARRRTVWAGPSPDHATWTLTASPYTPRSLLADLSETLTDGTGTRQPQTTVRARMTGLPTTRLATPAAKAGPAVSRPR